MPIAMITGTTLVGTMGRTKRIPPECILAVADCVRSVVERDFGGSQTAAAKALGVSQGHLSHVIRSADRGPGLPFLIALRAYTGKSIDALLGLEREGISDAERLARAVLRDAAAQRATSEPPIALLPPKKGISDAPRPRRR